MVNVSFPQTLVLCKIAHAVLNKVLFLCMEAYVIRTNSNWIGPSSSLKNSLALSV